MKVSVPTYLVVLFAEFVYAVVLNYIPTLPLTQEIVTYVILATLAVLNIDVTYTLRRNGFLK